MGYASRLARASARSAKANKVFEKLEDEYLGTANDARELYEELQVEIDVLVDLQHRAQVVGTTNEARARRIRDFLL